MDFSLPVILGSVPLILILFLVLLKNKENTEGRHLEGQRLLKEMSFSPEQLSQIESLLAKGKKIDAIKVIRRSSALDLKNSKAVADALDRRRKEGNLDLPQKDRSRLDKPKSPGTVSDEQDAILKGLLAEGKLIEAVKKYRDFTGVGLAEAKSYIEWLQQKP